ncbi:MAG TPA: hypothetical protein VG324_07635, partial [Blastocatellia bacterium]|nr:hypothetical protein [Blastocatellia bacterium]
MARGDLKPENFDPDVIFSAGFQSPGDPATYKDTNWCTPFCSPPKPNNLWATIRMNHGVQFSREFLKELLDTVGEAIFNPDDLTTIKGVPNATLERVRNDPRGYVICMTEPGKGHCVTPYRVDEDNKIWVYDNNAPGDVSRYIQIVGGDYDYPARRNIDRKSPNRGNGIFAYPISIWKNSRHALGFRDVTKIIDFITLIAVGSADVIVTNEKGGRWGWEDSGRFTDSYFGALSIPPLGQSGPENARSMPLLIAMNQPAPTVRITARGGQYYFHAAEGGHLFQIEANHASAGDMDQVRLGYANKDLASFTFTPQRNADKIAPRVGLKLSEGESVVFHWLGLTAPGRKTIEIGADRLTKSVSFRNSTGAATRYILVLDTGAKTYTRMVYGPIEAPDHTTQRIALKDWPDVSKITLELDLNGDGKPDRTETVAGVRASPPTPAGGFANLRIEKTLSPNNVHVGQDLSYGVSVVNNGPQNAT